MGNPSAAEALRAYVCMRCRSAVKALNRVEFDARFFEKPEQAVEAVLETIPTDAEVGCGGSWTLRQIGVIDRLRERGNIVHAHEAGMEPEESLKVRRRACTSPYYLSSANAITMEGEIVNVDGIGNRVAALSFGPATVIILAGYNKLVPDLPSALKRIREVAAPANALRFGAQTPCAENGRCGDCKSPSSICRITTIISRRPMLTDFKVFLIGEELGF